MRDQSHLRARRRVVAQRSSAHVHRAVVGLSSPAIDPQQRRLSRAVRSEQRETVAGVRARGPRHRRRGGGRRSGSRRRLRPTGRPRKRGRAWHKDKASPAAGLRLSSERASNLRRSSLAPYDATCARAGQRRCSAARAQRRRRQSRPPARRPRRPNGRRRLVRRARRPLPRSRLAPDLSRARWPTACARRFGPSFRRRRFRTTTRWPPVSRRASTASSINQFFDPARGAWFLRTSAGDGSFFGGEPIWVTAERAGIRTAAYFWTGSEAEIGGVGRRYWFPFDATVPDSAKIAEIMQLAAAARSASARISS